MKGLCLFLILFALLGRAAGAQFAFVDDSTKGTLTIKAGEAGVLTYRYREQLKPGAYPQYAQSCYIHPLYSPKGRILTDDSPADHPHHHGLFWTWPIIRTRGVSSSTWEPKLPRLRQQFVNWTKRGTDGKDAVLEVENAWMLDGKEKVAVEFIALRIHPAAEPGRMIDLELRIEAAGGPLQLQGRPDQNKGYGGLCFRGAPEFKGAVMTTDKGLLGKDAVHSQFLWADISTGESGIAVFASPGHTGFPLKWMIRNSYAGLINASWPGLTPVVLEPGAPAVLRYRIYIHAGGAAEAGVSEAYAAYARSGGK